MAIERVGIVGLGFLGRGIAACFLGHGFEVVGFTRRESTHSSAREYIEKALTELVEKANFPETILTSWADRYVSTAAIEELSSCHFVIESLVENLEVKQRYFDEVESVVASDVPVASNTSALPISQLQQGRRHPERFLGMHWAEPAHATRFLELIRGEQTNDACFDAAARLATRLGKEPCLIRKDIPGFIVNRLGYAMYREALYLLEMEVADAETIDRSFRNAVGLWATIAGPFRWIDLTGGPVLYARGMEHVLPSLSNARELPPSLAELAKLDAQGIVNGKGFFDYTDEDARKWEELFREHAWRVRELMNSYFPIPGYEQPSKITVDGTDIADEMIDLRLETRGYPLERLPPEGTLVEALVINGKNLFASGQVPFDGEHLSCAGKVPSQVKLEEARKAAALCAANVLRVVRKEIGSLAKVERVLRITGYVNSDPDFTDQHLVIDGASELVRDVFGSAGRHARTALGMAQLPLGASTEVEMILKLK